ncbi:MAG: metallophosphoesterase [Bdellovibrionota bacterium]
MTLWRPRLIIVLVPAFLFIYARWIEPNWIEVTEHRIPAKVDRPLKILQLSDVHTNGLATRELKVLRIIKQQKPDAIVISGDTAPDGGNWSGARAFLERLRAPLGVFLIRGNWEHWNPDSAELQMYRDAGITFLNNDSRQISRKVWIVGIDDPFAGSPDLQQAFLQVPHIPNDVFKIVLFHSPAYFDSIKQHIDLGLSGHTHGGQVRLPFFRPFFLPDGSGDYLAGWYNKGSSRMYVSRGVGNSIAEFRFYCRPEISVFFLDPY